MATMKPWQIHSSGKKVEDSFIVPLWAEFKPRDFYFASQWEDDVKTAVIYLVPREVFDKTGRMFEDSMPIIQHLPEYLEEILCGVYEADGIPQHLVEDDLKLRGFEHNIFFQKFVEQNRRLFEI